MAKDNSFITGGSPAYLPGQSRQTKSFVLDDISDVNAPSPTDKFLLRWDNATSKWIPSDTALKSDAVTGVDSAGNSKYYGTNGSGTPGFYDLTLNNLSDTNVSSPTDNYFLQWDSGTSKWIATENSAANITFDDTNLDFTATDVQAAIEALETQTVANNTNPNLFINGDTSLWQRSTTYTAATYPSVDRWRRWTSSMTKMDRVDISSASIGLRIAVLTASSADQGLTQRVESVDIAHVQGNITLSFWAKTNTSTATLDALFRIPSAKDNYVTSDEDLVLSIGTATTTWQRFSYTFDSTSLLYDIINGIEVGVRSTNNAVEISWAGFKLEEGNVATQFIPDAASVNEIKCRRYYQNSWEALTDVGTATFTGSALKLARPIAAADQIGWGWEYAVRMRTAPAFTLYNPQTGTANQIRNVSAGVDVGVTSVNGAADSVSFSFVVLSAALPANDVIYFHWTADAEL